MCEENRSLNAKSPRRKTVGALGPQYYHTKGWKDCPNEFKTLFEEFRQKALEPYQPLWYVKYAAVYFTYQDECYVVGPGTLDCSEEVFEHLSRELIDRLYELGAYEMFYSGMMD
nr:hypothetical protein [Lachnospiraceae bacterium]